MWLGFAIYGLLKHWLAPRAPSDRVIKPVTEPPDETRLGDETVPRRSECTTMRISESRAEWIIAEERWVDKEDVSHQLAADRGSHHVADVHDELWVNMWVR